MTLTRRGLLSLFGVILCASSALTAIAWWLLQAPATGIDDADIFLVYARHLSTGSGFVFDAGGQHVEGFTSLLWVLICAAVVRLSAHPEVVLLFLSVGLLAVTITACVTASVLRRSEGS